MNEYGDLQINDANNVHQNSVKKEIEKSIRMLETKYNMSESNMTEDCELNVLDEMVNCELLCDKTKNLLHLIFWMKIYSKTYSRQEQYLVILIWNIIKNSKDNIELFNTNLLDCYQDDNILCIDGRIARLFQTIGLNFISLWEYKEQITDIILYFINGLSDKNKRYKYLSNKLNLNDNENAELWLMNYELIKYLNKIFYDKYIKSNILDYNVLKNILLVNYKELFNKS